MFANFLALFIVLFSFLLRGIGLLYLGSSVYQAGHSRRLQQ